MRRIKFVLPAADVAALRQIARERAYRTESDHQYTDVIRELIRQYVQEHAKPRLEMDPDERGRWVRWLAILGEPDDW